MGTEHRRSQRARLAVDFRGKAQSGAGTLLFEGADLSVGGTFLQSDILLEQGETLQLEFRVPGMARLLRAQARIAWVRRFPKDGEAAGMGVQFLAMSEEDSRALSEYLEAPGA